MTITFETHRAYPGKLADAELWFSDGPLAGLKLIGFAVWERRGGGRNVTFPARPYAINGDRRTLVLLRASENAAAPERLREQILEAYAEYERRNTGVGEAAKGMC